MDFKDYYLIQNVVSEIVVIIHCCLECMASFGCLTNHDVKLQRQTLKLRHVNAYSSGAIKSWGTV
jgi:hypothetical protein